MRRLGLTLSMVFAAGALGGLVNSVVVFFFGHLGINAALGVHIAPALTRAWLYQRIVWGGIWGVLFLLPMAPGRPFVKGPILSLGPSAVTLLLLMPHGGHGLLGLKLGALTPVMVLFFNAVWGVTAALWLKVTRAPAA